VPVGVVEGDGRVCDGDARRGRMRISLAGDDGGGGLAAELLRDSAGPWLRGKHVLPRDGEAGFCPGGDCTSFANGQGEHVGIFSAH